MNALILGCGSIGRRHASNLLALGVNVVGVDPLHDVAERVRRELGITVIQDRDDAPAVDVVFVCTPSSYHAADLRWALTRGAHVFVEKPVGVSGDDAAVVREMAAAHPQQRIMVGCNMRFTQGYRLVEQHLPQVGRILSISATFGHYLPYWRKSGDYRQLYNARKELGGGVVLTAIHEIDYVMALAGAVTDVNGTVVNTGHLDIDCEDLAEIILRHATGVVSHVHLDYLDLKYTRHTRIIGSGGVMYWDYSGGTVDLLVGTGADWCTLGSGLDSDENLMYQTELEYFLNLAHHGGPNLSDAVWASRVLDVAAAAKTEVAPGTAATAGSETRSTYVDAP
jgi:predicted dehydrogenase